MGPPQPLARSVHWVHELNGFLLVDKARAIPTSRAYWELKAEQVLNRVFEPEKPIEVEVCDTPAVFF